MARHHAMLFPRGAPLAEVEALRRAWDPAMAAAIPAHLTLAYPEEHPGLEALRERVAAVSQRQAPLRLGIGEFRAFPPPDDGCVYLEMQDIEGAFAALRRELTTPPFTPIEFPPHLTLIHPRTSTRAAEFWRAGFARPGSSAALVVDAIAITAFENGVYSVLERFPLR